MARPKSVEEVLTDFKGRRAAIVNALTTDKEVFYKLCHPERLRLCLYGFPNKKWEVNFPAGKLPPDLPEPALGINFARDGMLEKDWLGFVADKSDAWLLAVAFFWGGKYSFNKNDRERLFNWINELPTIFEVVTGTAKDPVMDSSNKSESSSKWNKTANPKDEEEQSDEDYGDSLCGVCGKEGGKNKFWICCDICNRWFHGKCVKITPAKAKHIEEYKCPSCNNKRARLDI